MAEIVEKDICKAVADALKGVLGDVPVEGNFLPPSGSSPKGAEPHRTALARVTVSPRAYPAYTAAAAEVRADTEVTFTLAADPDLSRALAAFAAVTGLFEGWHADIRAAKAALGERTLGVRLAAGTFEDADGETKTRTFTHTLTIKTITKTRSIRT